MTALPALAAVPKPGLGRPANAAPRIDATEAADASAGNAQGGGFAAALVVALDAGTAHGGSATDAKPGCDGVGDDAPPQTSDDAKPALADGATDLSQLLAGWPALPQPPGAVVPATTATPAAVPSSLFAAAATAADTPTRERGPGVPGAASQLAPLPREEPIVVASAQSKRAETSGTPTVAAVAAVATEAAVVQEGVAPERKARTAAATAHSASAAPQGPLRSGPFDETIATPPIAPSVASAATAAASGVDANPAAPLAVDSGDLPVAAAIAAPPKAAHGDTAPAQPPSRMAKAIAAGPAAADRSQGPGKGGETVASPIPPGLLAAPAAPHLPMLAIGAAAAIVETRLAAALDSPAFAPALAAQVKWLLHEGVPQARLTLNPAEMGPVTVRIAVDGTQARVDFSADLPATRNVIEASLPTLAAALHQSGLTLTGGGVSDGQPRHEMPHPHRGDPAARSAAPALPSAAATGATPTRAARGLVDLVA